MANDKNDRYHQDPDKRITPVNPNSNGRKKETDNPDKKGSSNVMPADEQMNENQNGDFFPDNNMFVI